MTNETATTRSNPLTSAELAHRLGELRQRIATACARADRSPSSVLLVGVTKTHPPSVARLAVEHGVTDLGESRVQELTSKLRDVPGARWHLVGRLQRNKVRAVVGRQILVHSLDRRSLADALSRRAATAGVVQRVLVQVNVGDDAAKAGCDIDETLDLVAYARGLANLSVEGLMTVPPLPEPGVDPATAARPHFARLRALRDTARERWPEVTHLSMGMTADLEAAIAERATIVRVGTALFGPRGDVPWRGGKEDGP